MSTVISSIGEGDGESGGGGGGGGQLPPKFGQKLVFRAKIV